MLDKAIVSTLQTDMDSALNSFFDGLAPELKLTTGQAALSTGLRTCVTRLHNQLTLEIANLDELDPAKLTAQYTLLRLQLLLLQDLNAFFAYAGDYFLQQVQPA